ncbi:MAG: tetratricopeptide repeat protein, partial [Bryobacteraceae bacterium]
MRRSVIAALLVTCGAVLVRGQLDPWVQHVPVGPAIAALFRSVPMPGGAVPILLPPAEARPALTRLISSAPRDSMLYRLRARQAEVALDFGAAEADWKAYAASAADGYAARVELADFYHRRMEPHEEVAALTAAATAKDDPLLPATAQRGWRAFERMAAVAAEDALPAPAAEPVFRAWVARYPHEPAAWHKRIEYLAAHRQFAAAEAEISAYGRTFHDDLEPVKMRADLELRLGSPDAALAIYDRAFQPLWPEEMRASYFKLLEDQGRLREFAGRARTALAANPADLDATARLFHYFRSQNNIPAARRVLLEYRMATE